MLKAVVDGIDAVDEPFRSLYKEDNGKFVLQVEPSSGFALENIDGLKSALGKERTSRETLERSMAKFKDLDPDKAREALSKLEELSAIDPAKEADKIVQQKLDAATKQLVSKHVQESQAKEQRITQLMSAINGLTVDQVATAAIAEAKGSVALLLPHVRAHTRVMEDNGKFTVQVIDSEGNVRIADAKGTPMDIKGLVAEMRQSDTFGRAFDGSGNSGSGKQPSNGAGSSKTMSRSQLYELPPKVRSKIMTEGQVTITD